MNKPLLQDDEYEIGKDVNQNDNNQIQEAPIRQQNQIDNSLIRQQSKIDDAPLRLSMKQFDMNANEINMISFDIRLMDWILDIEFRFDQNAGIAFTLFVVIMVTFYNKILTSDQNEVNYPYIQVMFMAFLLTFLLNFLILRGGNIKPYMDSEEKGSNAYKASYTLLISMLTLFYCVQTAASHMCLLIWFSSWIYMMVIEYFRIKDSGFDYKFFFVGIITLVGSYLLLDHNGDINTSFFSTHNHIMFLSFLSSLALCQTLYYIKKLKNCHILTTIHIISLRVIILTPIFFPMSNLQAPNLSELVFLVLIGVTFHLVLICMIRSIQIEKPNIIIILFQFGLTINVMQDIILGDIHSAQPLIGSSVMIIGLYLCNQVRSNLQYENMK